MNEVLLRRLVGASVLLLAAFAVASLLPASHLAVAPGTEVDVGDGEHQVVRYDLQAPAPVGLKLDPKLQSSQPPPPPETAEPAPVAPEVSVVATAPATTASPAPAPTRGQWSIQVGSFADPVNANGVRDRLKAEKLPASLQEVKVGRALWYRVRVGPYRDEVAAKRALATVHQLEFRGARIVSD